MWLCFPFLQSYRLRGEVRKCLSQESCPHTWGWRVPSRPCGVEHLPGDQAGPEDIVGGEGEGVPRFALCRRVLNGSQKAASAQESRKDEVYCVCCLAKEVAVVRSCLACSEHHWAAPGRSRLWSHWTCSPSRAPSCRPAG